MKMMVLVSKQHIGKHKVQDADNTAFLPYLSVRRRHYHTKMQGKQVLLQCKWIFKSLALQDEQLWKQFLRPEAIIYLYPYTTQMLVYVLYTIPRCIYILPLYIKHKTFVVDMNLYYLALVISAHIYLVPLLHAYKYLVRACRYLLTCVSLS